MRLSLLLLLVACIAGPLAAAEPTPLPLPRPDAPAVVVWSAEQSLPDGPLADSRLDHPVRFWRAALSMEEVVQGIREQTGVDLRFWPPDDVNRRVRVNLYLSPQCPPPLRDLLAQLSWVLDCNLACSETEPRVYYLLGPGDTTGVVQETIARAKAEERSSAVEEQASQERAAQERPAHERAWLEQYQAALALPRKEAVAQYRGVDDRLALALVVPWRRVALQLLTSLPDDELGRALDGWTVDKRFSDLSAEQQASLLAALKLPGLPGASRIVLSLGWRALKVVDSPPADGQVPPNWPGLVRRADTPLLLDDMSLSLAERVGLRRWLGEPISQEEEARLREEESRTERERRQQEAAASDEQIRAQLLAEPKLSPEVRERLTHIALTWTQGESYALWQVEEAAAARTGLNVVSDGLYQPAGPLWDFYLLDPEYRREQQTRQSRRSQLAAAYPQLQAGEAQAGSVPDEARTEWHALAAAEGAPRDVALLYWLALVCRGEGQGSAARIADYPPTGKEWGSAGSFLRFRSPYRQLLPGLLLPEEALAGLQGMETPPLAEVDFARPPSRIAYRLDLKQAARTFALANDLQWQLVAQGMTYEDPATPLGASRAELRRYLARTLLDATQMLRLLATFTPAQWQKLTTTGLNCGSDLSFVQRSLPALRGLPANGELRPGEQPSLADVTLIAKTAPRDQYSLPGIDITFLRRGEDIGVTDLTDYACEVPEPLPHLVPVSERGEN